MEQLGLKRYINTATLFVGGVLVAAITYAAYRVIGSGTEKVKKSKSRKKSGAKSSEKKSKKSEKSKKKKVESETEEDEEQAQEEEELEPELDLDEEEEEEEMLDEGFAPTAEQQAIFAKLESIGSLILSAVSLTSFVCKTLNIDLNTLKKVVEKHAEQPTGHTPEAFIASITKLIRKITDNANIPTKSKIALVANYIDEFRETGPVGSQLAHVIKFWKQQKDIPHNSEQFKSILLMLLSMRIQSRLFEERNTNIREDLEEAERLVKQLYSPDSMQETVIQHWKACLDTDPKSAVEKLRAIAKQRALIINNDSNLRTPEAVTMLLLPVVGTIFSMEQLYEALSEEEVSQIIDDLIKAFRLLLNPADGVRALLFNATQILSVNYPQPYLILYDKLVKAVKEEKLEIPTLTMFKATVIACYAALFANDTQRAQELFEEQQMMNIGSEAREARVLDIHRTFLELSVELLCTSTPPRKESVQLLDSFIRQPTPWQPMAQLMRLYIMEKDSSLPAQRIRKFRSTIVPSLLELYDQKGFHHTWCLTAMETIAAGF